MWRRKERAGRGRPASRESGAKGWVRLQEELQLDFAYDLSAALGLGEDIAGGIVDRNTPREIHHFRRNLQPIAIEEDIGAGGDDVDVVLAAGGSTLKLHVFIAAEGFDPV